MGLNTAGDASLLANDMSNFQSGDPNAGSDFIPVVETILDNGFQKASPTLGNIDITPPAGSLTIPYQNPGSSSMPELIGQACADYWSAAIGFGAPESCSNIDSVTNDASKIASPIASNLRSLFTMSYLEPYYYDFVWAIHKEILTINWTVVESDSSCNATFTVNVT